MRLTYLDGQPIEGGGPYVQFTDEEHEIIDEALACYQRSIAFEPGFTLSRELSQYMSISLLRDSLHPVWRDVKELQEQERKEVESESRG